MWLITLFLGAVVIYLMKYWVNSYFNDWEKRGIPYSPNSSPFMMLFRFIFTKKGLLEMMKEDYDNLKGHKFAGFFQMFSPGIMLRDADLAYRILIKDFSFFVDRTLPSSVSDLFTESLGSLTGDKWRTLRHKMTPTFTSGKLKVMFDPIKGCCEEAVKFIDKHVDEDVDSRDFAFKFGINVIGKVAFGLNVDALNEKTNKDNEFLSISRKFFQPSFLLMVKFMVTMTMPKVRKYIKFSMIEKDVDIFFKKLVKDMIEHREKTGEVRADFLQLMLAHKKKEQSGSQIDSVTINKKTIPKIQEDEPEDNELLDQLQYMNSGDDNYKTVKVFSDDCIISQTFMFISAGSETTAASASFVLFQLSQNPDCQKKVQKEVDDAIARHGFTYNAIKNLKYMEQFMNESMRFNTIAPFLGRMCTQNYKIPDSDVVIEKGTFIGIPVIGINHDPQYFQDPEKFDPDRFEDEALIHPVALLAFGAGPRMCIAKRLALLEMKMLMAAILQKYTVVPSPKTKLPLKILKASVFQHVEGGVWVKFQKRK